MLSGELLDFQFAGNAIKQGRLASPHFLSFRISVELAHVHSAATLSLKWLHSQGKTVEASPQGVIPNATAEEGGATHLLLRLRACYRRVFCLSYR